MACMPNACTPNANSELSTTTISTRYLLSVLFLLLNDGHESLHVLNLLAQPCTREHPQVSAAAMHPPQYLKVYYLRRARRPCQPNPAMHRVLWKHVHCSISKARPTLPEGDERGCSPGA